MFVTRMKEYRVLHGLTQKDLAIKVGCRRETISSIERGIHNPSLKLAIKIAFNLDASIDELFIYNWEVNKNV